MVAEKAKSNLDFSESCTVRLATQDLKNEPNANNQPEYCSGTMIDERTLVTAAHCLSQVFSVNENLDNLKAGRSAHFSFAEKLTSSVYKLQAGPQTAATSSTMNSGKQRGEYIASGKISGVNGDYAVVKLASPAADFSEKKCPRLPADKDCEKLDRLLKEKPESVYSLLYLSNLSEQGKGAAKIETPWPSSQLAFVKPSAISLSQHGHLTVRYSDENQKIKIKKGDSGASLIWESEGEKAILGVLSGSNKDGNMAFFSNLCSHISNPRWQAISNSTALPSVEKPAQIKNSSAK
jgi:hypothetical protein